MVKTGYAEVYHGSPPRGLYTKEYKKTEDWARNSGQGIWSQGDKYIFPALWRKSKMWKIMNSEKIEFVMCLVFRFLGFIWTLILGIF